MNKFASDVLVRANQKLAALTNEGMTKQAGLEDSLVSGAKYLASGLTNASQWLSARPEALSALVGAGLGAGVGALSDGVSEILDRAKYSNDPKMIAAINTIYEDPSPLKNALVGAALGSAGGFLGQYGLKKIFSEF